MGLFYFDLCVFSQDQLRILLQAIVFKFLIC